MIVGAHSELVSMIFQSVDSQGQIRNLAVAFTSTASEAGVSYVVKSFANILATETNKRVVVVDARAFHDLHTSDVNQVISHCEESQIPNLMFLSAVEASELVSSKRPIQLPGWHSNPQIRQAYLKALRRHFDYVIIDCPALSASSDANALAPIVDGIALVVDSTQTRHRQARSSQQVVESAGGSFLGYILNQRPYQPRTGGATGFEFPN